MTRLSLIKRIEESITLKLKNDGYFRTNFTFFVVANTTIIMVYMEY